MTSSLLIKNANLVDPNSKYHLQKRDILVNNRVIEHISEKIDITNGLDVIDLKGKKLSLGWVDMHLPLTIPGDERRENLESLLQCAEAGGVSDLICHPTTHSPLDNPDTLISLKAQTKNSKVHLHFVASPTKGLEGKEMSEIGLLAEAGAIAFSNGNHPIIEPKLLIRILQYLQKFQLPLIQNPHLPDFNDGQVNDSEIALQMGFKGIPVLSETLVILNTLEVLKYYGGKVHFSPVTTMEGWEIIFNARQQGFDVTADCGSQYLHFEDFNCLNYNVMNKVFPPYRGTDNRCMLIANSRYWSGIGSLHQPVIKEEKDVEFGISEPGIIHLQTAIPLISKYLEESHWIDLLTHRPAEVFPFLKRGFEVGLPARFTIYEDAEMLFTPSENKSLSANSPFFGQSFPIKIHGII